MNKFKLIVFLLFILNMFLFTISYFMGDPPEQLIFQGVSTIIIAIFLTDMPNE